MTSTLRAIGLGSAAFAMVAAPITVEAARKPLRLTKARPIARPAVIPSAADRGVLLLATGENRIVNLSAPMADVIIADPTVLDVHVRSQTQLVMMGKGAGQTDVTITSKGGAPLYKATVRVGSNLTSLDQMLRVAMPEADIRVTTMNGAILLTGTVAAPEDAQEAEQLVNGFSGGKMTVLSRLKTATPLTVNLQVRIAEVNKQLGRQIGMNLNTVDQTSGFKFGIGQGRQAINQVWTLGGPLGVGNGLKPLEGYAIDPNTGLYKTTKEVIGSAITSATSGTTLGADTTLFGLNILAALDLAENQGLAATLANPNLTALSGETASFLAGGEIPIPMASSLGQISVDYKQYGVSLAFTPTVLADGRISMRVRPEVSQLDDSSGVKLNGFSIPGVSTRRAETTVELGSGQSFVIGGLLSSNTSNSISKAPFLGSLPVLGNLFKSQGWNRRETELVIVVTPYLVRPVNAADIHLPTDGLRNPTDAQRYIGAQLHDGKTGGARPLPTQAPRQTVTPDQVPDVIKDRRKPAQDKSKGAAPGFSF